MTSFHDLSVETFCNVLEYLHLGDPADMKHLSLVCKPLYELSEPYLREDYDFKRAYMSFSRHSRDRTSVENVLEMILLNSRAAFMIERLHVVDSHPISISEDQFRIIRNAVRDSKLIHRETKDLVIGSVRYGDCDFLLGLLLTLLPNIVCLVIDGCFNNGTVIAETVQSIASQKSRTVLSKLSEVNIIPPVAARQSSFTTHETMHRMLSRVRMLNTTAVEHDQHITSFELLQSFATLPSVQILSAEYMVGLGSVFIDSSNRIVGLKDNREGKNDDPMWPSKFKLTTLNLRSSLVPMKILTKFLGKCTGLENFEYTPAYFPLDPGQRLCDYVDYVWQNDSLLRNAESSLKSLKLLLHVQHKLNLDSFVSLREFLVLTDIEVDMAILTRVPRTLSSSARFPLLSEVLPASARRVSLTHHGCLEMLFLQCLVSDLILNKARDLPVLEKLEIRLVLGIHDEPLSLRDRNIIYSCEVSCVSIGLSFSVQQLLAFF